MSAVSSSSYDSPRARVAPVAASASGSATAGAGSGAASAPPITTTPELPGELLQDIFSRLDLRTLCGSAALVCRRWRQWALQPPVVRAACRRSNPHGATFGRDWTWPQICAALNGDHWREPSPLRARWSESDAELLLADQSRARFVAAWQSARGNSVVDFWELTALAHTHAPFAAEGCDYRRYAGHPQNPDVLAAWERDAPWVDIWQLQPGQHGSRPTALRSRVRYDAPVRQLSFLPGPEIAVFAVCEVPGDPGRLEGEGEGDGSAGPSKPTVMPVGVCHTLAETTDPDVSLRERRVPLLDAPVAFGNSGAKYTCWLFPEVPGRCIVHPFGLRGAGQPMVWDFDPRRPARRVPLLKGVGTPSEKIHPYAPNWLLQRWRLPRRAGGSSLALWNLATETHMVLQTREKDQVHRVHWHPRDPRRLLTFAYHDLSRPYLRRPGEVEEERCALAGAASVVWDLRGDTFAYQKLPILPSQAALFSPHRSDALALWSDDKEGDPKSVRLWRLADFAPGGRRAVVADLPGHTGGVRDVTFHPLHPGFVATADGNGHARLWRFGEGRSGRGWRAELLATVSHRVGEPLRQVLFHPYRVSLFVTASDFDHSGARIWDLSQVLGAHQRERAAEAELGRLGRFARWRRRAVQAWSRAVKKRSTTADNAQPTYRTLARHHVAPSDLVFHSADPDLLFGTEHRGGRWCQRWRGWHARFPLDAADGSDERVESSESTESGIDFGSGSGSGASSTSGRGRSSSNSRSDSDGGEA